MDKKGEAMTSPTGKSLRSSAFTLLELLMVMALVGILLGLALPRFASTTQDLRLVNSARNLAKLLTYAQQRAIMERLSYQALFDGAAPSYWLQREHRDGSQSTYERIQGRYGRVTTFPAGIDVRVSEETIVFYPDGTSDPFTIELSGAGRRLRVMPGGGVIRVQEEAG